jgi:SPP1 family holin
MNTKSIISIAILVLGIINWLLAAIGISPLAVTGDTVNTLITLVVSVVGAVGTAWYNLSVTDPAKLADELMHNIKEGNVSIDDAVKMVTQLIAEGRNGTLKPS